MKKSACVIPCYNEKDNLSSLCLEIENFKNKSVDWYLINNGSTDIDNEEFNSIINKSKKSSNIYTFYIENNKGVGHGIKTCLLDIIENYEVFIWTHADGQTPIKDVLKSIDIYFSYESIDIVKGIRVARSDGFLATIFTSIYNLILIISGNYNSRSPNAQPTLIKSSFAKYIILKTENDANFDVSVLLYSNRNNAKIVRFPVLFKSRSSGKGANESIFNKFRYSFKTLYFLLRKGI